MDNLLETYVKNMYGFLDNSIIKMNKRKIVSILPIEKSIYDFNIQMLQSYRTLLFGKPLEL